MDIIVEVLSILRLVVEAVILGVQAVWGGLLDLGKACKDASVEVWLHCTQENLRSLFALGLIVYVFPDAYSELMEKLKKTSFSLNEL